MQASLSLNCLLLFCSLIFHINCVLSEEDAHIARVGVLIDFNHDLNKGINNDSIEQFIRSMHELSTDHLTVIPSIIDNYDQFVIQVEDDPRSCSRMTAIVSAVSCEITRNLYEVIEEYCPGTVILSILDRTCSRPSKYRGLGFPVRTSIVDVVPMLMDMRYDFLKNWHQIHLIHDESIKEDHLTDIVYGLTSREAFANPPEVTAWSVVGAGSVITVTTHHNCSAENERRHDMRFTPSHLAQHVQEDVSMQYFIVLGKSGTIEEMIEQAHAKDLMASPRRWLFVVTDQIKRKSYWDNLSPILALTNSAVIQRRLNPYAKCHRFSEDCQFVAIFSTLKEALQRASHNISRFEKVLQADRVFLRNRLVSDLKYLITLPRHNDHCGNCDRFVLKMFQIAKKKEDKKPWLKRKSEAKSVWLPEQDFSVYISEEGEWIPAKGYMAKNHVFPAFLDKGLQFKQKELRVAIFEQLPRVRVNKLENGSCNVTGSTPQILRLLEERLNFTIKWDCSATTWGHRDARGQWTGVMKLLVDGKVDMAGNGFWKLPSWRNEVKWSAAFYEESVSMMVQKSAEDHKWLFLLPFTWDVWHALLASLLLIGVFIWYVNRRCKYYDYNNIRRDKGLFSLGNCFWYSYGAMVNQGGDYLPPSLTSRMIVAFWWLFVIVVATAYSGNLVACLTFPKILQPIQNAEDVAQAWFLHWATQEDSPIAEVTKVEKFQPIALLSSKMQYENMAVRQKYIFDEVGDDSLAWIGLEEEIKYFVSLDYLGPNWEHKYDGLCRLHKAKDDIYRAPIYFPFNKNFDQGTPRRQGMIYLINEQLLDLGMSGFIAHWMKYYAQLGNDCLHPTVVYAGDVRKIEMMHMYGSYIILFAGMALSVLFFIGEILYWRCIRPCLPEKWKTQSYNTLDYYNKVFVGYGYSNVRLEAPQAKPKPTQQISSVVQTMKAGGPAAVAGAAPGASFNLGPSPRPVAGGAAFASRNPAAVANAITSSIYDPNYSGSYNTRTNYNYYKYGNQKNTNFAARFGMEGGIQ